MSQRSASRLDLHLHHKQGQALQTEATEVLYGGAAGGGKSYLMRVAAILWCAAIAGLQVYLFRRIRDDLVKNHMEGPKGLRAMLADWAVHGFVTIVEDEIRFWNGSKIYLCHCKDEKDIYKYQGAEIHVLLVDEVTHFTETMYRFLRNRVRMVGITLPEQYRGKFPRILASGNPGNIGHLFVKATFIDGCKPMALRQMPANEGGMLRQYIPAQLDDNPSMQEDDPGYEHRLEGLGSEALVRAMRHGDWDVVEGAFFDCWERRRHVVRPFRIPDGWLRFRAGDWGSAKPFSFGWYAVASDDFQIGPALWLPRGGLVRYREWYGIKTDADGRPQPNVGLKLFADAVGKGIADRSPANEKITYGVLDPSAFKQDGGPPISENIYKGSGNVVLFRPADNTRVPERGAMSGWDQMRARLVGESPERPMLVFFETCLHAIRTIPVLQHDKDRPEDLDTDGEDHCFAAGTLVETLVGAIPIERLASTGLVHSSDGLRAYRSARLTRRSAPVVRLKFSNGREVVCTPDHKFLVGQCEWRYARDLLGSEVLCSPSLSARPSRSLLKSATTSAAPIFNAVAFAFTEWCGWRRMAQSLTGITFITLTAIQPTTLFPISNVSGPRITCPASMGRRLVGGGRSPSLRLSALLPAGTAVPLEKSGTPSILKNTSERSWKGESRPVAWNAATHIWSALQKWRKASSAPAPARRARCVSVEELNEPADVYCLTVPSTGCFAIEGGLIVSNCADEVRYACNSRPWARASVQEPANKNHPLAMANLIAEARRNRLAREG